MRNRILLLVAHIWMLLTISATAQEVFQRTLDLTTGTQWGTAQEIAPDRFIATTTRTDLTSFRKDGTVLWSKLYSNGYTQTTEAFARNRSHYFIAGETDLLVPNNPHVLAMVIATDTLGNVEWTWALGLKNYRFLVNAMVATPDGGVMVVGAIRSTGDAPNEIFAIRIGSDGNLNWARRLNTQDSTAMVTGVIESDNAFIITGTTGEQVRGVAEGLLIKIGGDGTIIWSKTLDGNGIENINSIVRTGDGGFAIAGSVSLDSDPSHPVFFVARLDSAGTLIWERSLGFTPALYYGGTATITANGNRLAILTGCYAESSPANIMQLTVLETDGSLAFSRRYATDSTNANLPLSIARGANGFVIAARVGSAFGGGTLRMIHTDAEGNSGCNQIASTVIVQPIETHLHDIQTISTAIDAQMQTLAEKATDIKTDVGILCDGIADAPAELSSASELQLHPDPLPHGARATLSLPSDFSGAIELTIADITGAVISRTTIDNERGIHAGEIPIDTRNLSPGMYLLTARHGGAILRGKLIVR